MIREGLLRRGRGELAAAPGHQGMFLELLKLLFWLNIELEKGISQQEYKEENGNSNVIFFLIC